MPETQPGLLARLAALGIDAPTLEHPAVFTVTESKGLDRDLPGAHVKNLFLRPDGAGPYLLLTLQQDRKVSINALARQLGAGRSRFASPEQLMAVLGVTPGSVTPLAMVNAAPGSVRIVLDRQVIEDHALINCHPLVNTATTSLAPADLLRFLRHLGHEPELLDLDTVL